nr:uncharacterized protein LOC108125630 [Drosophila bipectinata]
MDLYAFCYQEGLINPYRLANIDEYLERKRILRNLWGLPIRTVRINTSPGDFDYLSKDNETERAGTLFFALKEFTDRSTGWRVKVVQAILVLGGFILTNLYLTTLSSILTSGLYEPEYNTLEDLAKAPYPSLHDAFYVNDLKSKTFLPEALRRNAIDLHNNTLLSIYRDSLNESYMYVMYEGRRTLNLMQQRLLKTPRFHTVPEPIGFALDSILVSRSLPYLNILNQFMRRLQEHGIFIKIKADVFQVMIEQGIHTLMRDNEPPAKPFDLEYYFFAFALWGAGLVLSLLFFLVEILKISYKTH